MADSFPGIRLQEDPRVFASVIPGRWLLKCTTPSWRIDDPERGFQRMVSTKRARQIAAAVLDQRRTFPNAIVLATNATNLDVSRGRVTMPRRVRFLVVDGQHRLWAQKHSEFDAEYCCIVHVGLTEEEMAQLFVEINDNQKRVPSSLRWDLVRLVRPDDDPSAVRSVDLILELNSQTDSPLYQRIDLTGEQKEITLKQGSLAPDIKALVRRNPYLKDEGFDVQLEILIAYFAAIRNCDADGWDDATSYVYRARVLRALLRLLSDLLEDIDKHVTDINAGDFSEYLDRIDLATLDPDVIKGQQGGAGIKAIYDTIVEQIFVE